ncbi:MAG TPA: hypothetical protein VKA60_18205 [Blastocatellia bacterium]|nr:hypothetical protein [Blastocatellia bacterium]
MLASKAVVFTHLPVPIDGQPYVYTRKMIFRLIRRVLPHFKAYLRCRNIGLVYVYVDTGIRLTLRHLLKETGVIQFTIAELEFEQNTRNCLKLAVDKAVAELSKEPDSSFKLSSAPHFQFIGLPHLLTLIHSLYRIDPGLIYDLGGSQGQFTYDSPKFVEAIIRLVRGIFLPHSQFPIFRFDEDVKVNEVAIGRLLEHARAIMDGDDQTYWFFSGGYGRLGKDIDPVDDFAIRLHWLADRHTRTLSNQGWCFVRDLGEIGATQIPSDRPLSDYMNGWLKTHRSGASANRAQQQVISGAGLFMSLPAIQTLPPFMNFHLLITWIDDHLKRRLHEVLGHLAPPPEDVEHIGETLFSQNRHPNGITDGDIKWAKDYYFERLLSGCIMHALITTADGEMGKLAQAVDEVLQLGRLTIDEEDLRHSLQDVATMAALSVLDLWAHADYGSALLSNWAKDMVHRITSWRFYAEEFREPSGKELIGLALRLRQAQDPLSRHLLDQFLVESQQQVQDYSGSAPLSDLLKNIMVEGLNRGLESPDLLNEAATAGVRLTEQIRRLQQTMPTGEDLIRLNRLILEEAYPDELPKHLVGGIVNNSISYVHLVRRWYQYVGAIQKLAPVHAYWLFRPVEEHEDDPEK